MLKVKAEKIFIIHNKRYHELLLIEFDKLIFTFFEFQKPLKCAPSPCGVIRHTGGWGEVYYIQF